MARACPKCQRPNAETAAKCLYCSEPLPEVTSASNRKREPEPETAAKANRYLVILFPTESEPEPSDSKVEVFARITGLGLYESRQRLRAQRPRLFRRVENEVEARTLSRDLVVAEVGHYVVEEASLLSLPVSRARSIALHERHLQAVLELDGAALSVPHDDLLLVVHGEIARERHHEKRLGSSKGVSKRLTPGRRLHLYARDAAVAVEIEPDHFDWMVLGEARTSSSLLNAQRLLSSLEALTPATLDGGFDDEPVVLSRSSQAEDPSSALSDGERGADGVVWDNEEQFRYYARWRYRLERYLAGRASRPRAV